VVDLWRTSGDYLECSIDQIKFADGGFQALSYEWGNPEQTFKIIVRDTEQDDLTSISLTRNLLNALKDLQDSPDIETKRFWIDQICINQKDSRREEASSRAYGRYLPQSLAGITYLGPQSDNLESKDCALRFLDRIMKHFAPGVIEIAITIPKLARTNPKLVPLAIDPGNIDVDLDDPRWTHLLGIVYSDWTHYLWIVQENILCHQTNMLRGHRILNWISVASIPIYFQMNMLPIAFLEKLWPSLDLNFHPTPLFNDISLEVAPGKGILYARKFIARKTRSGNHHFNLR
jgi:Heterokaryon incompatibility protein (HET)